MKLLGRGSTRKALLRSLAWLVPLTVAGAALAWQGTYRRQRRIARLVDGERYGPGGAEQLHAAKVQRLAEQLRAHDVTRPVSLRKKSVSHQVPKAGDLRRRDAKIDVGSLDRILHIDPVSRRCTAEPGVTFEDLVAATLAYGLVPKVVPELRTITLGGAVAGCSIESMSFVHGGFHDTCSEYEVLTAKGERLVCTPDNENALVFQMVHGTFGTVGVLTKLTFSLVEAKPFVHLLYERHTTLEQYQAAIRRHTDAGDVDFIDGIIHSPTHYVLSVGRFTESVPYTNRYDWLGIYYRSTAERSEDYLGTEQYLFRYDRGVTNVYPKSFLGRLVFGKWLTSARQLRLAELFPWILDRERPTITLDVFVPFSKVPEFLRWYEAEFGFYPLWCVPYRRVRDYEWLSTELYEKVHDGMFLDLAIYGMKQDGEKPYHQLMEAKLRELGGVKTLISHNYYSEADFWKTWNEPNYRAVKARTDPDNVLRDLYAKTCRTVMGLDDSA